MCVCVVCVCALPVAELESGENATATGAACGVECPAVIIAGHAGSAGVRKPEITLSVWADMG